jgi:hypothetical protein
MAIEGYLYKVRREQHNLRNLGAIFYKMMGGTKDIVDFWPIDGDKPKSAERVTWGDTPEEAKARMAEIFAKHNIKLPPVNE